VPDYSNDDLLTECRIYHEGIALFNAGQFFEAHDAWEEIWKLTLDKRRERFYRAITQSAVTLELLRRGRAVGVRQVFCSCVELFEGLPEVFMGLHISGHIENIRRAIAPALEDLETRFISINPASLFQIVLVYDPFKESRNGEDACLAY
jgi:predicted metal-dependent hydrolase